MSRDDPALAAWLLARYGADGPGAGRLDEDLVVGYLEGRLTDEEHKAVEARLAEDAAARELLGFGREVATAAPRRPRAFVPLAAAAAVLVALGAIWAVAQGGAHGPGRSGDGVLEVARGLEREDPAAFGGLVARMEAERVLEVPPVTRGDLRVLRPLGEVLAAPRRLRWTAVAGVTAYAVAVSGEDGERVFERTVTAPGIDLAPDALALVPGSAYVIDVRAEGPFGDVQGTARFRMATAEAQAAHERALASIGGVAQGPDRAVLVAYYALLEERYEAARDAVAGIDATISDERVERLRRALDPEG